MIKTSTLKPGFLVSLKTSIKGGVEYQRIDLDTGTVIADGAVVTRWETRKEVRDPIEFERATQARNKARSIISAACLQSSFGLLCPLENEQDLQDAIQAARDVATEFNMTSKATSVEVFILAGIVAQSDVEAARAIRSEVGELMQMMQDGIANADAKSIREAADKARQIGGMLSDDVAGQVNEAIAQARKAAREITKRVEKAGETAATVVSELATDKVAKARFFFLDMGDEQAVEHEAPAGRGLDLEMDENAPAPVQAPAAQQRALEI